MNKQFLAKVGIVALVVGSIGFLVLNKDKGEDVSANNAPVIEEDFEDTYIDDGYGDLEDVDLNEEFEDKVESNKGNEDYSDSNSSKPSDKTEETTKPDKSEEESDKKEDVDSNEDKENAKPSTEKNGVFQGFADSSFVEIKIGDEYRTFRVSSDAKKALSNKNIGDNISFEVTEDNGQSVITTVK